MKPYADTNLLTRVYLELPGSAAADQLLALARSGRAEPLPMTWLHRIELANALEFCVWLGRQAGHPAVTPEQAAVARETFREDLASKGFLRPERIDTSELEPEFERLCLRYTAKHGFRTYDLLHVATARLLKCDSFWSFDGRAQKLATIEGMDVPAPCLGSGAC